jgi:uncharacterized protein YukJ
MFTWDNVKNPTEVKRYAFDWSEELGPADTITGASAVLVDGFGGGLVIEQSNQFEGKLSYVKVSGGTAGQTARIQGTIAINGGDQSATEVGYLVIAEASDPTTSTLQDLNADLIALRKARIQALQGGQVKEVWREGRRVVFNVGSIADLNKAILEYETLIELAVAQATSNKPRFRAIRPGF